jgi:hypothetical protein
MCVLDAIWGGGADSRAPEGWREGSCPRHLPRDRLGARNGDASAHDCRPCRVAQAYARGATTGLRGPRNAARREDDRCPFDGPAPHCGPLTDCGTGTASLLRRLPGKEALPAWRDVSLVCRSEARQTHAHDRQGNRRSALAGHSLACPAAPLLLQARPPPQSPSRAVRGQLPFHRIPSLPARGGTAGRLVQLQRPGQAPAASGLQLGGAGSPP